MASARAQLLERSSTNSQLENGHGEITSSPRGALSIFVSDILRWPEMKEQLKIAGPMIFINIFTLWIQLMSVMFVGHLGSSALSRSTIATSFANVVGVSVLMGMSTALDTLCGQAYGAKQYRLLGVHLQRAVVVLILTAIPLAVVFAFAGNILELCGQNSEISRGAGEYSRWLIPVLFGIAFSQPHMRFLLAQSLVIPMIICAFITLLCHMPICWALVYHSGLGYRGAALATSISFWINVVLLVSYVNFSSSCRLTRPSPSWEALRNIKQFVVLGLPSAAMICLEWWCYELLVLIAGLLPDPELEASVLSICLNTGATVFQIPFGIGAAVSTRVSNQLGAGRPQEARDAVRVALRLALSEALVMSIILICSRNVVGRIYSDDQAVISYVSKIMLLVASSALLDAVQANLSGVARGCGLQKIGAAINLGSYYLVGLPVGCCLAFLTSLQGEGLWITGICAPFVQSCLLSILVWRMDWDKQAVEAAARVASSTKDPSLLT